MTQGERIKEVRKVLKMNQADFGKKLGVGKTAVSKLELGENALTDQMAKSICREYNVNSTYLLYGKGEMFDAFPETVLDDLCKQYSLDDLDRTIIAGYLQLDKEERAVVKRYIQGIVAANKKEKENSNPEKLEAAHERTDVEVTAEMKKHDDDIMNDDSKWE